MQVYSFLGDGSCEMMKSWRENDVAASQKAKEC